MFLTSLLSKKLIGLDIGATGIKAIELRGSNTPRLLAYNRVPIPKGVVTSDGDIADRKILIRALKELFKGGFSTKKVVVSSFGNSIIMKKIVVPKMTHEELENQLYWEVDQYIPNSGDANLDFVILGELPQSKLEVLLIAAKKDYISSLASVVEDAGLTIEAIDNYAFALGNVFEFNYGHLHQSASNIVIDVGGMTTKFVVIEKDKTTFGRELRIGGVRCTEFICEHMGLSEFSEAEKQKISASSGSPISEVIGMWNKSVAEEISKTLDFYISQNKNISFDSLYLCGGASQTIGLIDCIKSQITIPIKQLNPLKNIAGAGVNIRATTVKELKFFGSLSLGLALRIISE